MDKGKFTPAKAGDLNIGDIVVLVSKKYEKTPSQYNPHYLSKYFKTGRVNSFYGDNNEVVEVAWGRYDNPIYGEYLHSELAFIADPNSPTRSILILNEDIYLGKQKLVGKGKRLITEGDYAHTQDGRIFIKVSDRKEAFNNKKVFTEKQL